MELREYISSVIGDIVDGLKIAKENHTDKGVIINPKWSEKTNGYSYDSNEVNEVINVQITASVSVSEASNVKGGVNIASFIKTGVDLKDISNEVGQVKFTIPIMIKN